MEEEFHMSLSLLVKIMTKKNKLSKKVELS
jgi:hypothetical protein